MRKQEKTYLIIIILIAIIALSIFFITRGKGKQEENKVVPNTENKVQAEEYVQVLENGTKLNTSTKLNETKTVGPYKIEDIQLTNKNGQTVLLANVTNVSNKETKLQLIDVVILDKKGNELGTVGGIIAPLKAGKSTQLNTGMSLDYSNAYDFKIVLK